MPDRAAAPDVVPHWIRALAERFGDRELAVGDGGARITYAEADARSARTARALVEAGVGKGTHVGVCFPNGLDWIVAWLAVARIGAVAVPVNTFFKARELGWVLRHADVAVLLTAARVGANDLLAQLEAAAPELGAMPAGALRAPSLPQLRRVFAFGGCERPWATPGEALAGGARDARIDDAFLRALEAEVAPSDPMILLYSSGSTAEPKGAVHGHGSVLRHSRALSRLRGVRGDDRVWSPMPFFWVGGFVFALLGAMHAGACLLTEATFDPGRTLALLERERATAAIGWPHFGKALVEHPDFAKRDLSSLRAGNLPGLLPPSVCPADPELRPNGLGMTETCGPHTYTGEEPLPEERRRCFGPALAGVEHKIVDPASGAVLGAGETGEICVRGGGLMQGLYKQERAETFDADGWYHTGDAGSFTADGLLYFRGRLGEMIKSAGANVTPSEVESVLAGFAEVKAAFVVGVAHRERGENVAAAVVLEPGAALSPDEVRARTKAQLAAYKVPRHVWIAPEGALPFTDTGKIEKRKLRALLEARVARGEI
ncbi:MAG: acyl-CoA synthetase [Proteobacteria bacterium]|nr:MAG: acyl-CoA synthetase [Pseudomonadota bacterium]